MAVEVDRVAFERDGGGGGGSGSGVGGGGDSFHTQSQQDREQEQQVSESVIDCRTRRLPASGVDSFDGATNGHGQSPTFTPTLHRLDFLTRCGNIWAGCFRDKAQHCWSMFTKRKKGRTSFFSYTFITKAQQ